jgi:hypothetical protein
MRPGGEPRPQRARKLVDDRHERDAAAEYSNILHLAIGLVRRRRRVALSLLGIVDA